MPEGTVYLLRSKSLSLRKRPGNNPAPVVNDAEESLSSYIQPYLSKSELI